MEKFKDLLSEFLEQKIKTANEEKQDAYRAVQWFILDYELKEDLRCKE